MEVNQDINNGLVGGLSVEYLDEIRFVGFFDKTIFYNNAMLGSRVGYGSDATGYIGGQVVQLSFDEGSELFSWINFSMDNDDRNVGLGKSWFDIQYGLDSTLLAHWDSKGWTGGLLLNKVQGEANFAAGLVDIDQNFKPKLYVEFSTPLEKFSSKILLKSGKLKSQYLPWRSMKSFRRKELARQWGKAMDFSLKN